MSDPADSPAPPSLRPSRLLWRGLRRRCPLCGRAGLFSGFFTLRERCPTCNYPTTRVGDQWIGAFGINIMVSFTSLVVAIAVGFAVTYPDPPFAVLLTATVAVAVVVPIVFFPISKTLWAAIDLAMRPPDPDDDIDPRWIPSSTVDHD